MNGPLQEKCEKGMFRGMFIRKNRKAGSFLRERERERERERVKIARHSSPFILLIIDYLPLTKLLSIPEHSATDCISLAFGPYPSSNSC